MPLHDSIFRDFGDGKSENENNKENNIEEEVADSRTMSVVINKDIHHEVKRRRPAAIRKRRAPD